MARCQVCRATGVCPHCKGKGRFPQKGLTRFGFDDCPTCKKSTVCPSCKGTRKI